MLSILLLVLVLAASYGAWQLAARAPRSAYRPAALWQLACLIGVVRIAALWLGAAGLRSPGRAQVWGYLLLMTDLPEFYLTKGARGQPLAWAIIGTAILAVTSVVWAWVILWIAARLRPVATSG